MAVIFEYQVDVYNKLQLVGNNKMSLSGMRYLSIKKVQLIRMNDIID